MNLQKAHTALVALEEEKQIMIAHDMDQNMISCLKKAQYYIFCAINFNCSQAADDLLKEMNKELLNEKVH